LTPAADFPMGEEEGPREGGGGEDDNIPF